MMMIAFATVPTYTVPATNNTDYAIVNTPSTAATVPVTQPAVVIPRSAFIANDTPVTPFPTFTTANATTPTALFGAVPTATPKYVTVVAPAPRQVLTGLDATGGITPPLNTTPSTELASATGLNNIPDTTAVGNIGTNTDALTSLLGSNTTSGTGLDTSALTGLLANAFTPKAAPRSTVTDETSTTADTAVIKDKLSMLQDDLKELKAQQQVSNESEPKTNIASSTPRSAALESEENKKSTEKDKKPKGIKTPDNTDVN